MGSVQGSVSSSVYFGTKLRLFALRSSSVHTIYEQFRLIPMPGRTSTRNSAVPRVSRKQSSTPVSVSAVPDEGPTTTLRTSICGIFADAQKTTAGHRKLVANLRKTQETCCYEPQTRGKKGRECLGEEEFNTEIARCIIRVVPARKGEEPADRIIRFLGLFLRHASEKGRFNQLISTWRYVDLLQMLHSHHKPKWTRLLFQRPQLHG